MTVEEQLAELKAANEAQAAKNAELATQVATLLATQEAAKTASEAADTARQAAEERVKTLEAGERSRRFSDLVDGKGGAGDGLRWYGPKEDHLKMMEALSTAFGEDSEPFKNYVSMQEGNAKRLNTSGIFEEKGTRGAGEMQSTGDPVKDLVAAVRKDKPTMTEAEAYAEVMNTSEGQKAYNEQVKLERRQQARE